jgi:hypothetical protein
MGAQSRTDPTRQLGQSLLLIFRAADQMVDPTSVACSGCALVYPVPATGAGCRGEAARYYAAIDVVRLRVAEDFDCAPASVRIVARNDITFQASGCGQNATYMCEADAVSGCSLEEAATRESCQSDSNDL